MFEKHRGTNTNRKVLHLCVPGHVTTDSCRLFPSCCFQDQVTAIVAVQTGGDYSLFTQILMKIPMTVFVLLKGVQANRVKLITKVYLYLCWFYNTECLLLLIGQIRGKRIPESRE